MTWKSYAAVSGAGLLATYLFSAPPTIAPGRAPARPEPVSRPVPSFVDIQEQAARLSSRERVDVEYRTPVRNPFRFVAPPAVRSAARAGQPRAPQPPPVAPEPAPPPLPIRLAGITSNTVAGVAQRSAVLMTLEGLVTVREGDAIGPYRVARIEEHAVELAGPDGTTRRLNLRP